VRARQATVVFRELREGAAHERERAGVSVSREMAERTGGGLSRGWVRGWWPEFTRTWVRPWRARGPGVRGGGRASSQLARALTRRPHWVEREKASELTGHGADRTGPHGGESGEGERRARDPPLTGGGRLSARAGAGARAAGPTWADMGQITVFLFPGTSNCFSIYFL
jgi:hypothetical protein